MLGATLARYAAFRWMSPMGSALAWLGWGWWIVDRWSRRSGIGADLGMFAAWGVAGLATLTLVGTKAHHEYYGLLVLPPLAAGAGWVVGRVGRGRTRGFRAVWFGGCLVGLLCSGVTTSISTFRTPESWSRLREAGEDLAAAVPSSAWVSAEEALLFAADRRGFRLEWTAPAIRRAVAEWPRESNDELVIDPEGLVEFHRQRGARFVAVLLGPGQESVERLHLASWLRRNAIVRMDRAGVVLVVEWPGASPTSAVPPDS